MGQWRDAASTTAPSGDQKRESLRGARINPYADWKVFFDKAETSGEEVIREKSCYKVAFTTADGATVEAFFDKDTGLLVREVSTASGGAVLTTDFTDWEESQGILSARSVRQKGLQSFTVKITSVSYDVDEIPEGTFDAPAALK